VQEGAARGGSKPDEESPATLRELKAISSGKPKGDGGRCYDETAGAGLQALAVKGAEGPGASPAPYKVKKEARLRNMERDSCFAGMNVETRKGQSESRSRPKKSYYFL